MRTLSAGFLASAERYPERPALTVEGSAVSYRELRDAAARLAATLDAHATGGDAVPLTAVFGHRHLTAFAGILGALFRGHGYVPLNPVFPADRTRAMLERSGVSAMIVDTSAIAQLDEVVRGLDRALVILVPDADGDTVRSLASRLEGHTVLGAADLLPASSCTLRDAEPDAIAYLLFTSGSTGIPKGVMVAQRNATAFLDVMLERYQPTPEDRFSHTFDLTFDLSVFDLFMAWWSGACVCCPTAQQKAFPGKYALSSEITIWFSVPSSACSRRVRTRSCATRSSAARRSPASSPRSSRPRRRAPSSRTSTAPPSSPSLARCTDGILRDRRRSRSWVSCRLASPIRAWT